MVSEIIEPRSGALLIDLMGFLQIFEAKDRRVQSLNARPNLFDKAEQESPHGSIEPGMLIGAEQDRQTQGSVETQIRLADGLKPSRSQVAALNRGIEHLGGIWRFPAHRTDVRISRESSR